MSKQGFDRKDLEEICSRKPAKFKMNRTDFKELGLNVLKGSFDVAIGSIKAIGAVASLADKANKSSETSEHLRYTWEERPYESENRHL